VFSLHSPEDPQLRQVGGKAFSLITMTRKGFPVPSGFVLAADFFEPWLKKVRASMNWKKLMKSADKDLRKYCDAVKKESKDFPLSDLQKKVLEKALALVHWSDDKTLFAVRSSSPEEDLDGASFAGGYETTLGVTKKGLEKALRTSFVSCLDYRIFVYKREKGFDVSRPSISVIVQEQLDAECSGVAFSLNPINNSYDEAVINSNFGLGETVVAGQVTPDHFVVDKSSQKILEEKIAVKSITILLKSKGGTSVSKRMSRQSSLSRGQVLEVTTLVTEVENAYDKPMDIEWAYARGKLCLLQARPITAYVPLPPEMITKPGEQKFLYWDATLGKQGIHEPMSVMGGYYLFTMGNRILMEMWKDPKLFDVRVGIAGMHWGRMYQNFSNYFHLLSKKGLVNQIATMDVFSAEVVRTLNMDEYTLKKPNKRFRFLWLRLLTNNLLPAWRGVRAWWSPESYKLDYKEKEQWLLLEFDRLQGKKMSLQKFMDASIDAYYDYFKFSLPTLIGSEVSRAGIKALFAKETKSVRQRLVYLERALPDNITIEMGMSMYDLAHRPEVLKTKDEKVFLRKWKAKEYSKEFVKLWNQFMKRFGFRSPRELDLGSPGYRENPGHFFQMLKWMSVESDPQKSPRIIFEKARVEREQAYEEFLALARKKGVMKSWVFKKCYTALVSLGGLREIHKYYIIMSMGMLYQRLRKVAQEFVKKKRLDRVEDIFSLKIDEVEKAMKNPRMDLRKMVEVNTAFLKKLSHITHFPPLIDSRGRILRPIKKHSKKGELDGQPISPGKVIGKVKVLRHPEEKPLLPGEILVAQATDPGWTPLFTNAGGIILELGGMLQHGALVAREYGKPCIAGVNDATKVLKDGMVVEMDGLEGTVRVVSKERND
jgi:pyruvate,water dikinase